MNGAVVPATQQGEIRERGGAPSRPVPDVMALPEPEPAARQPTAAVTVMERPPEGRRNRACPGPDLQQAPGCVVAHHDPARVARQALRRSGRNAQPVLEDGLTGLVGVGQDGGIHVNHHLVAFSRRAGIDAVMERALGEQGEGVGGSASGAWSRAPTSGASVSYSKSG